MKTKHTPGPWTLIDKTIVDANGDSCIEVLSGLSCDLKLVVAAPELLEALEVIVMCFYDQDDAHRMRNIAKTAIRKAKGE